MTKFHIGLFFSLLLIFIGYWRWFFTPHIYAWGDWGFHWPEIVREWFLPPQVWLREFMGKPDAGLPLYVSVRFFYGALAHFLPFVGYDRLVFMIPSVLVPAISIYLLVMTISKNPWAALAGSIVYSFNSYILLLNAGHLTLSTAYAIGPLVFLLFRGALKNKSLKYAVAAGLAGSVCSAYEVRGYFLVAVILLAYLTYYIFISFKQNLSFEKTKKILFSGLIALVIPILTNLYWVAGFLQTSDSYYGVSILSNLVGETAYTFPRSMILFSPWWTGDSRLAWGQVQPVPLYFWPVGFLALFGYWLNRHDKEVVFWFAIALIGLFLVKMMGDPFPKVYPWLFEHFPGFMVFRDSSKFNYFVSLSYAVLIGQFVATILKKNLNTKIKAAVYVLIISLFLVNAKPLIQGDLGKLQTPRHIPDDYLVFKKHLLSEPDFSRTLYVPSYTKWSPRDSKHRMLGMRELLQSEWSSLNSYKKTGLEYSMLEEVSELLNKPFANQLLDASSIKYVVVPLEDIENEEMFIFPKEIPRQKFIDLLDSLNYLRPAQIPTSNLKIYENLNPSPQFSMEPKTDFSVKCEGGSKCKIYLQEEISNATLHFSDYYHRGWKIKINKGNYEPDYHHVQSFFNTNLFKNLNAPKGSTLTLYFAPQRLVDFGSFISLSTVLICCSFLLKTCLKRWK